jgi:outer membrane biosynthesis protein TonB
MKSPSEPDRNQLTPNESSLDAASTPLTPIPPVKRRVSAVLFSVAMHGGVLALVVLAGEAARHRFIAQPTAFQAMAMVKIAGGSHAVKFPLPPMDEAARIHNPDKSPDVTRKTILPVEQPHPKVSGGGAPVSTHKGNGSGQALQGNGGDDVDARPAFPVFSPHPPVNDRSLLPPTEQKIVVDVKLDELGQVVSETLVKGMGNRLDKIVLDIALTWRFQPATLNGKPVASEAELIFPFNSSYPITGS